MMRRKFELFGAAIFEADRTIPGRRVDADNCCGKWDRVTRSSYSHDAAQPGTNQFANAVEQCAPHRPVDRTIAFATDYNVQNGERMPLFAPGIAGCATISGKFSHRRMIADIAENTRK